LGNRAGGVSFGGDGDNGDIGHGVNRAALYLRNLLALSDGDQE
jgi:hypothetical protein